MSSTGILTVDTHAIADNWRLLSTRIQRAKPTNRCGAVVKANAYGLGVKKIAPALQASGCNDFFVASLAEAIELRECLGSDAVILVFGGLSHGCGREWLDYQLLPVLIDQCHVQQWAEHCRKLNRPLPCALKADTGMHRLGVLPAELEQSLASSSVWEWIDLQYFMSHLACADTPDHPLNQQQREVFVGLLEKVRRCYPNVVASLANSSGMFLSQDFCFQLGRPGIALYGGNPAPGQENPMKPVVQLDLPVMQCRTIQSGEVVGYGASFMAERETRLATVFGGYADGLMRALSTRAVAFAGDQAVPLVGRVSMDSMVFDVTDLDSSPEYLTLLNQTQTIERIAQDANTIGYEILTSLGGRYQRIYIE